MCEVVDRAWIDIRVVRKLTAVLLLVGLLVITGPANGQIAIVPPYDSLYSFLDLGPVPGLPSYYGGLTFLLGEPDTLLIGGSANTASGLLYSIEVIRDSNYHVVGFSGSAAYYADAAYNDGGVTYGPDSVLFLSRWPVNELGQTMWGSTITDKIIDLDPLGVAYSHAALSFVPDGFLGEGQLKFVSWPVGEWYTAYISPDGAGTYDIDSIIYETQIGGGPEGFIYVPPGSPLFPDYNSMLVSEWSDNEVAAYQLDSTGNPIPATRVTFITGLNGAEGAAIDPLTGDFLFSTFGGGDRVIVVQGFAAPGITETTKNRVLNSFQFKKIRPNPFNRHTTIEYVLSKSDFVTLKVYDILGQEIKTLVADQLPAGTYAATWNASEVASGVYFCRLECNGVVAEKKLLLIR